MLRVNWIHTQAPCRHRVRSTCTGPCLLHSTSQDGRDYEVMRHARWLERVWRLLGPTAFDPSSKHLLPGRASPASSMRETPRQLPVLGPWLLHSPSQSSPCTPKALRRNFGPELEEQDVIFHGRGRGGVGVLWRSCGARKENNSPA